MSNQFLSTLNYWAVLVSGVAYWITGSLWFSALFGNVWSSELEKQGVTIKEPTKNQLIAKLIQTFLLNLLVAFGTAFFVFVIGSNSVSTAVKLGLLLGICFSSATIGIAYTWESGSLKLILVDCGYAIVGITICSIILTLWK